jgi:hypothetical protein
MDSFVIDQSRVRDISGDVLDNGGRLRILPTEYWANTTPMERALLGHRNGLYSFPTLELVEHLRQVIDGRSAIEIGAGHGVLAEALGIPATDSRQQEKSPYREFYAAHGQPPVRYGPNIIECDASRAVRRFSPQVVIGCWVTQKYDPSHHGAGGNEVGIDEEDILRHCEVYIVIGNDKVHASKKIWERKHEIARPLYVYSRSANGTSDFIAIWNGGRAHRAHSTGHHADLARGGDLVFWS